MKEFAWQWGTTSASLLIRRLVEISDPKYPDLRSAGARLANELEAALKEFTGKAD